MSDSEQVSNTDERKETSTVQRDAIVERLLLQREKKNAYNRIYRREKRKKEKEDYESLKAHQIASHQITIKNNTGKLVTYDLNSNERYMQLIEDLLVSLQNNHIIEAFTII